jgi:hypothetical protein
MQQIRKKAVTREKMEPRTVAQWEGKQRIFLESFKNNTYGL